MVKGSVENRGGWPIAIAACLCGAIGSFDLTANSVVLHTLTGVFGVSPIIAQWASLAYLVPIAGFAIPFGRWLDTVGRRGAAVLLCVGFALSSVLAATATGFGWLIAARLLQGFFAAGIFPLMNVLTNEATAREHRSRVSAVYAGFVACGGILGPSLGAVLTATLGWRWIYGLSSPILLIAAAVFLARLSDESPLRAPSLRLVREGLVLLIGVSLGLLALTGAAEDSVWWLGLIPFSVAVVVASLYITRRSSIGALPPNRHFTRAVARLGMHSAGGMSIQVLLAFQAQQFFGLSVAETGAALTLVAVGSLSASAALAAVGHRASARWLMIGGFSLMAIAGVMAAIWNAPGLIGLCMLATVLGLGQGLARSPAMLAAIRLAPAESVGAAAGAISLSRNVGYTAGPASATMVWGLLDYSDAGLRLAMLAAAGFGLIGSWLSISRTRGRTPAQLSHIPEQ